MAASLIEAVGLLLLVVAAGLTTGAAFLISTAVALLVGGVWALFLGVVMVLIAQELDRRGKRAQP